MDDIWDDSNYDVECWDDKETGNFIFNCGQERNVTDFEEIDVFGTACYLPEESSDEYKQGVQHVRGSIFLNELTQIHGMENERGDNTLNNENTTTNINNNYSSSNNNNNDDSSNNNDSNNNININKHNNGNLKRKALNNNIIRSTKRKTEHDDKLCSVCFINDIKYRFPCCGKLYCSALCFKKHDKESCLAKMSSYNNFSEEEIEGIQPNEAYHFSTDGRRGPRHHKRLFSTCGNKEEEIREEDSDVEEYCLTEDQKNKIKNDLTLKWLLKNDYVRSVFREFVLAKDKVTYLSQYIGDPTIVQVFDQIMKSLEGGQETSDSCY